MIQTIEFLGCKMELVYLTNEPMHTQQQVEILYMIDNEAEVQTDIVFELKEKDIVVFNIGEKYAIQKKGNAIVFRLMIPYRLIEKLSTDEMIVFRCNSVLYTSSNYSSLLHLVELLLLGYLNLDTRDMSHLSSLLFQIIHELFEKYKLDYNKVRQQFPQYQKGKINRILNYIQLHYSENLSLPELAECFNMSETYLSRYFKRKTGQTYKVYLNEIRVQNAMVDLIQTEKNITMIALDNGFSTPSAFDRCFKSRFEMTPSEFRKEKMIEKETSEIKEEKVKVIQQQISSKLEYESNRCVMSKVIKVNAKCGEARWDNRNTIINIGEAVSVSDARIQEQVLYLKHELGISYMRIWNLFSDKFMITKNYKEDSFNFSYLDSVLDFFVQNDIMLFLDMGYRRRVIMENGGRALFSEAESPQFVNALQWEMLLQQFMRHLMHRYGKTVLEKWIFEFPWNLDPYYQEGYNYIQAFQIGRSVVKNVLSNAKIAGLSPNITVTKEQLMEVIKIFKEQDIFPDIVTMRVFLDLENKLMEDVSYKKEQSFLYARQFVERIQKMVRDVGGKCRFCLSEWSNSISNRNPIQDSCARGTIIINFVSGMFQLVDMMGFWYGTDAIDVFYDTRKILYGGGGILTKDGIRKPSFYAFQFLNQLGKELLKIGNNYIITRDSSGTIIGLFYNQRDYSYYYYIKDVTEQKNLGKLFQSEENVVIDLEISNVERDGIYSIKEEVVNSFNGNVQNEWALLGNQEELGKSETQYLKSVCIPRIYMKQLVCVEGKLNFDIKLEPHEMRLIHITSC